MYGPGIPILFPLGLLNFIVLYALERYKLAYYYRKPPNFSEELNTQCMRSILWGPALYAAFGFWMYSNRQIFENETMQVLTMKDVPSSNHRIIESFFRISPGTPLLIVLAATFLARFFEATGITNKIQKYFIFEKIIEHGGHSSCRVSKANPSERVCIENTETFFSAIRKEDKKWIIDEEKFLIKNF